MKKIIIANWKCNPTKFSEARQIFNQIKSNTKWIREEIVICPPSTFFSIFKFQLYDKIKAGAQDCFWEDSGAYTGAISCKMLKNLGVKYVIIGHSERRKIFKETDELVNKKIKSALKNKLVPVLCVGEGKGENSKKTIEKQLKLAFKGLNKKEIKKIIIAYEPIWAIGTGNFCSTEKANEVRKFIKNIYNNRIVYGGSVNSKIAVDYIKKGFDGLLVGGASLKPKEFVGIVKNV